MDKKPYTDRRFTDDPKFIDSQCNHCAHYSGFGKCKAYPKGIPKPILYNEFKHTKPYDSDNGIRYKTTV